MVPIWMGLRIKGWAKGNSHPLPISLRQESDWNIPSALLVLRPLHLGWKFIVSFPRSPDCQLQILGLLSLHNLMSQVLTENLSSTSTAIAMSMSSRVVPVSLENSNTQLIQKYFTVVKEFCSSMNWQQLTLICTARVTETWVSVTNVKHTVGV